MVATNPAFVHCHSPSLYRDPLSSTYPIAAYLQTCMSSTTSKFL